MRGNESNILQQGSLLKFLKPANIKEKTSDELKHSEILSEYISSVNTSKLPFGQRRQSMAVISFWKSEHFFKLTTDQSKLQMLIFQSMNVAENLIKLSTMCHYQPVNEGVQKLAHLFQT